MHIERDVSFFRVRPVFSTSKVERDVKKVGFGFIGLDCDL